MQGRKPAAELKNWQSKVTLVLLVALALVSCGKKGEEAGAAGNTSSTSSTTPSAAIKHYKLEQLPELDDSLPPLDGGRVEVAPPKEWNSMSRDAKFVARFVEAAHAPFIPRITIKVTESSVPDVANLSRQNARSVASQLAIGNRDVAEVNKPIVLGDNVWVRHVRQATMQGDKVAIQSLQTIRGSRLYVIELVVSTGSDGEYKTSLEKYRNLAYAVAGRMKFLKDEAKISGDETEESEAAAPLIKPAAEPATETMPAKTDEDPAPDANPDPNGNPTPPAAK